MMILIDVVVYFGSQWKKSNHDLNFQQDRFLRILIPLPDKFKNTRCELSIKLEDNLFLF